jgi:hypothetical protein
MSRDELAQGWAPFRLQGHASRPRAYGGHAPCRLGHGLGALRTSHHPEGSRSSGASGRARPGGVDDVLDELGIVFRDHEQGGYCYDGAVTSEEHRGTSYIPAGRYQDLSVQAIGNWTITIRTGFEPVGSPIKFIGSGQKALPPFRLRSGKTMYWTNTGTIFQTYPAIQTKPGTISSQSHRGKIHLPAGHYRFFVNATAPDEPAGHWTIVVR